MEHIIMAHGSGGEATGELISNVFAKHFQNEYLAQMEDSTVVPVMQGSSRIAMTTDSFVVTPYIYPGGDIGRLAVCGTVNDLLMSGAVPKYLTCGFILEEGLPLDRLEEAAASMAATAKEAGVVIAAGDTKVIENRSGQGGGLMINTAGVGFIPDDQAAYSPSLIEPGDAVIVSGDLGDHHAAILASRMGIENTIVSDNAPLGEMVRALKDGGIRVHEMRDVTRGGLATVLHEFSQACGMQIVLREEDIPVSEKVRSFCGILGLDPLYMGNEGKLVAIVKGEDADEALRLIRSSRYGENAVAAGYVRKAPENESGMLLLETPIGGMRVLGPLFGEGLPRIC